jgi:hypothetical protein
MSSCCQGWLGTPHHAGALQVLKQACNRTAFSVSPSTQTRVILMGTENKMKNSKNNEQNSDPKHNNTKMPPPKQFFLPVDMILEGRIELQLVC